MDLMEFLCVDHPMHKGPGAFQCVEHVEASFQVGLSWVEPTCCSRLGFHDLAVLKMNLNGNSMPGTLGQPEGQGVVVKAVHDDQNDVFCFIKQLLDGNF